VWQFFLPAFKLLEILHYALKITLYVRLNDQKSKMPPPGSRNQTILDAMAEVMDGNTMGKDLPISDGCATLKATSRKHSRP
jgi:hypothetical protein